MFISLISHYLEQIKGNQAVIKIFGSKLILVFILVSFQSSLSTSVLSSNLDPKNKKKWKEKKTEKR